MPTLSRYHALTAFGFCASVLLGFSAQAGQSVIYRWVDENGTIHYSDAPPDTSAQPADLPEITIVPARKNHPKNQQKNTDKKNDDSEEKNKQQTMRLSDIRLVRPKPEENLWGTGGTVTAEAAFSGRLPRGYAIRFVLDGKPLKPTRKKVYVIRDVIRGEHQLLAEVIALNTGKVVAKTPPVTFYLKQATVNMHNNG